MKRLHMLVLMTLVIVVLSTGCGTKNNNTTNGYKTQSKEQHMIHKADSTHSDKVAKDLSKIRGVDKATVVIHNKEAIVGLDVKQGENLSIIEQDAVRTVKRELPNHNVHVTADKNLHMRIQSLHQGMKPLDGHPVRNFSEDVTTLIKDIGRTVTYPLR
ncbi:hypothetical protein H70357_25940 [Paenibacillus sp. FSL H7-0357]|uniref:YhcN/YlaJ family sporulation lipoprotein n=1 Tax=unclassified Paenibacillus TaxID=185978 RepID=UPI0004F82DD0|nr:YhcN/YlaJ family sporulation lipoprotein [Paenibacillus sp. FSL H7-0357]AIQ19772.1 hypothetical protein H70357_25940 [Paenibacillus sp. FSL H7-0357]